MQHKESVKSVVKKSLLVAGVASLLLVTGCASNSAPAAESLAPSVTETASASSAPTEADTPATVATQSAAPAYDPHTFDSLVYADQSVKAGESLRVTGGGIAPNVTGVVYLQQLMPMPSYDAANDMYHAVGEAVKLSAPFPITTNAEGKYDIQLPVPADLAPQQVDVIVELDITQGATGGLSRTSVR